MIQLGLERISRLLAHSTAGWRAIHVAGTNGKGSICAYISAMLKAGSISCGRFTSPHLLDRWDCITINDTPITRHDFEEVEAEVLATDRADAIHASEFEILTATAFNIFSRHNVMVGVVECGMGGRLDATNVIQNPLVTVISRIGLDHQAYLGNTIEKIAAEKAGIIKHRTPCVVDGRNLKTVQNVIQSVAIQNDSKLIVTPINTGDIDWPYNPWQNLEQGDYSLNEQENIQCAATAIGIILPQLNRTLRRDFRARMLPAVKTVEFPGRLQSISIKPLTGRSQPILLDGAHNEQAARRLTNHVSQNLRKPREGVTWVLALSEGRAEWGMLRPFIKPYDNYIFTTFGPVDRMPWVKPTNPSEIVQIVQDSSQTYKTGRLGQLICAGDLNIREVLQKATDVAGGGPIVVTGSLYLVAEVLRIIDMSDKVSAEIDLARFTNDRSTEP